MRGKVQRISAETGNLAEKFATVTRNFSCADNIKLENLHQYLESAASSNPPTSGEYATKMSFDPRDIDTLPVSLSNCIHG